MSSTKENTEETVNNYIKCSWLFPANWEQEQKRRELQSLLANVVFSNYRRKINTKRDMFGRAEMTQGSLSNHDGGAEENVD